MRHRVKRVLDSKEVFDDVHSQSGAAAMAKAFVGDLGVSFLTL